MAGGTLPILGEVMLEAPERVGARFSILLFLGFLLAPVAVTPPLYFSMSSVCLATATSSRCRCGTGIFRQSRFLLTVANAATDHAADQLGDPASAGWQRTQLICIVSFSGLSPVLGSDRRSHAW